MATDREGVWIVVTPDNCFSGVYATEAAARVAAAPPYGHGQHYIAMYEELPDADD